MGIPNHSNGTIASASERLFITEFHALKEQNATLQKAVYLLHEQLQKIEEQQSKDSAELTEISMILNELLPYARRAAQMMDGSPLNKLRAALGKNNGTT